MGNVKENKKRKKSGKNFFFSWYLLQGIRKMYILKFNVFHSSATLSRCELVRSILNLIINHTNILFFFYLIYIYILEHD